MSLEDVLRSLHAIQGEYVRGIEVGRSTGPLLRDLMDQVEALADTVQTQIQWQNQRPEEANR